MNTPNKLTIARIIMVPVFMAVLLLETVFPSAYVWTRFFAGLVFVAAAVTDAIDGNMARKYNLITDFGKFLDPLADKMLVLSALICFVRLDMMLFGVWMTVIVLLREFLVTSLRLVAKDGDGLVIAASVWGKLKTILQMVAVCTYLFQDLASMILGFEFRLFGVSLADVIMLAATAMTVISGLDYLKTYAPYIDPKK